MAFFKKPRGWGQIYTFLYKKKRVLKKSSVSSYQLMRWSYGWLETGGMHNFNHIECTQVSDTWGTPLKSLKYLKSSNLGTSFNISTMTLLGFTWRLTVTNPCSDRTSVSYVYDQYPPSVKMIINFFNKKKQKKTNMFRMLWNVKKTKDIKMTSPPPQPLTSYQEADHMFSP